MNKKIVFVTWAKYTKRADYLSRFAFNCENICMYSNSIFATIKCLKPIFYILYFVKSIIELRKHKPDLIIAQCGPIFCPFSAYIYSCVFNAEFIVDAHTGTWTTFSNDLFLQKIFFKKAKMILIHNKATLRLCKKYKNLHVLYDYPIISNKNQILKNNNPLKFIYTPSHLDDNDKIVNKLISIFSGKEHYELYVTGEKVIPTNYSNIHFVGFLDNENYSGLLTRCNISIILLTRSDSNYIQSCRAIEAISYELPIIHTETDAIKELLSAGGGLYIKSNDTIESQIKYCVQNYNELKEEIKKSKNSLQEIWSEQFKQLKLKIAI